MSGYEGVLIQFAAYIEEIRPHIADIRCKAFLKILKAEGRIFDGPIEIRTLDIQFELFDAQHTEVEDIFDILYIERIGEYDGATRSYTKKELTGTQGAVHIGTYLVHGFPEPALAEDLQFVLKFRIGEMIQEHTEQDRFAVNDLNGIADESGTQFFVTLEGVTEPEDIGTTVLGKFFLWDEHEVGTPEED